MNYDYAIVGANGFLGKSLIQYLLSCGKTCYPVLRSTNLESLKNIRFSNVIFAAGNSKTYISNKDPLVCLKENVIDLFNILQSLNYNKFIYLSSSVVYSDSLKRKSEDAFIDCSLLSTYGMHKYLAEQYVKRYSKGDWLILRPTGFYGEGLKKNLLFDLKGNQNKIYYNLDSMIDYMPVEWFCEQAVLLGKNCSNRIINIGAGVCVQVKEIIHLKPKISYEMLDTRWIDDSNIDFTFIRDFGIQPFKKEIMLEKIKAFINS